MLARGSGYGLAGVKQLSQSLCPQEGLSCQVQPPSLSPSGQALLQQALSRAFVVGIYL